MFSANEAIPYGKVMVNPYAVRFADPASSCVVGVPGDVDDFCGRMSDVMAATDRDPVCRTEYHDRIP